MSWSSDETEVTRDVLVVCHSTLSCISCLQVSSRFQISYFQVSMASLPSTCWVHLYGQINVCVWGGFCADLLNSGLGFCLFFFLLFAPCCSSALELSLSGSSFWALNHICGRTFFACCGLREHSCVLKELAQDM